jgi:Flagellar hook-length control protein FliK
MKQSLNLMGLLSVDAIKHSAFASRGPSRKQAVGELQNEAKSPVGSFDFSIVMKNIESPKPDARHDFSILSQASDPVAIDHPIQLQRIEPPSIVKTIAQEAEMETQPQGRNLERIQREPHRKELDAVNMDLPPVKRQPVSALAENLPPNEDHKNQEDDRIEQTNEEFSSGGTQEPLQQHISVPAPVTIINFWPAAPFKAIDTLDFETTASSGGTKEADVVRDDSVFLFQEMPKAILRGREPARVEERKPESDVEERPSSEHQAQSQDQIPTSSVHIETNFTPSLAPFIMQLTREISLAAPRLSLHTSIAPVSLVAPSVQVVKSIRVALQPEHLGVLNVTMHLRGGELELKVEVETAEAHARLAEDKSTLTQLLSDTGYAVSDTAITIILTAPDPAGQIRSAVDAQSFDQSSKSQRQFNEGHGQQKHEGQHTKSWQGSEDGSQPRVEHYDHRADRGVFI